MSCSRRVATALATCSCSSATGGRWPRRACCPIPPRCRSCKELAPELGSLEADSEVGRIAALPSPDGIPHSISLLALGAAWLIDNTRLRRYVAHCHPKLLDLYRLAGAEVVGGPRPVPGRADPHLVIAGRYDDAAASVRPGARGGVR